MTWMFTKAEVKRNLIGALEVALFIPDARKRFGNTTGEAVRSFFVPLLLLPIGVFMIYLQPEFLNLKKFANGFTILYCFEAAISLCAFVFFVRWIAQKIGRLEHFNQFVIALNWLFVPSTLLLMPIFVMLLTGMHSWHELYPLSICAVVYTYSFMGYMAKCILRVPWEIGGFLAIVSLMIDSFLQQMLQLVNSVV